MSYICLMCEWEGDESDLHYNEWTQTDCCPSCNSDNIEEQEEEDE